MAIRIPLAKEQVDIASGAGAVPTPHSTRPPADAFGANVAEAQGNIGKAVQSAGETLSKYMVEKAKVQADATVFDMDQKIDEFYTNKLYGEGTVDVPVDAADAAKGTRQIPAAYMRQTLNDTHGGLVRLRKDGAEVEKMIEPYKNNPYLYEQMRRSASIRGNSAGDKVLEHESTQTDKAMTATFKLSLDNSARNMSNARSDKEAIQIMNMPGGVLASARMVEARTGESQAPKIANAVHNYAMSKVGIDGSTVAAKAAIATFGGVLDKYDQAQIGAAVDSRANQNFQNAELQTAREGTAQAVTIFQDLMAGKDLPSQDAIAASKLPLEWKTAITTAVKDAQTPEGTGTPATKRVWGMPWNWKGPTPAVPGTYTQGVKPDLLDTPDKAEGVANFVAEIMKSGSQQEQMQALLPVLTNKTLNIEEKTAIIELALQRNGGLVDVAHKRDLAGVPHPVKGTVSLAQQQKDAAVNRLVAQQEKLGAAFPEMFSQLNRELVNKNVNPDAVYDKIMGKYNLAKYPEKFADASEEGTVKWDKLGNKVLVYKDGRVVRQ